MYFYTRKVTSDFTLTLVICLNLHSVVFFLLEVHPLLGVKGDGKSKKKTAGRPKGSKGKEKDFPFRPKAYRGDRPVFSTEAQTSTGAGGGAGGMKGRLEGGLAAGKDATAHSESQS